MSIDLGRGRQHPLLACAESIDDLLDDVAGVDPIYLTVTEKQTVLTRLATARARLEAVQLRVLAAADDVAQQTGDRSTAHWLARQTRDAVGTMRRDATLGKALHTCWKLTGRTLAAGVINAGQARTISDALNALPATTSASIKTRAEEFLLQHAQQFGPRQLKVLGAGVLQHLAPEIGEEAEYQKLLAEEERARPATKLFFRHRGDGSTDLTARIPTPVANRLKSYLDGYTSPRNRTLGDISDLPIGRGRGLAFCALLEHLPASGLPRQGGTATTITVSIDWDTLRDDLDAAGVALTSTGGRVTVHEARRLACTAGIMPFVMGGKSVIHDQGRAKRLFTGALRTALNLLFPDCAEVDCTVPADWSEGVGLGHLGHREAHG